MQGKDAAYSMYIIEICIVQICIMHAGAVILVETMAMFSSGGVLEAEAECGDTVPADKDLSRSPLSSSAVHDQSVKLYNHGEGPY